MSPKVLDDNTIRRYLLGFANESEQQKVEEVLLLADAHQIAIVEDDLIEQYLADELNHTEKAAFESHFLAPNRHRENLRFAKTLQKYINRHPEPAKAPSHAAWFTMPRFAIAAAALAALAAGWLAMNNSQSAPFQVPQTQLATTEKAKAQPFVLSLSAGLLRSAGNEPVIDKRPISKSLEIHLALPQETSGFASYSAVLETVEGHEVWRQSGLNAESGNVKIVIPTSSLSRGDWRAALSGTSADGKTEGISSYYFRVLFE